MGRHGNKRQHRIWCFAVDLSTIQPARAMLQLLHDDRDALHARAIPIAQDGNLTPVVIAATAQKAQFVREPWREAWPTGAALVTDYAAVAYRPHGTLFGASTPIEDGQPPRALLSGIIAAHALALALDLVRQRDGEGARHAVQQHDAAGLGAIAVRCRGCSRSAPTPPP